MFKRRRKNPLVEASESFGRAGVNNRRKRVSLRCGRTRVSESISCKAGATPC
jgi:hypothetical protein